MVYLLFGIGLVLLTVGAEVLVRGSSRLAVAVGISPLVVGLTVVAFGTSAPELAVAVQAAISGPGGADLAIGNVVGSNIFNILLILGLASIIAPLVVQAQLVRIEIPLLIVVSVVVLVMAWDGNVSRVDGLILFAAVVVYTFFVVRQSRRENAQVQQEYDEEYATEPQGKHQIAIDIAFIVAGLAMLVIGANWLVDGAISMARAFGVSELVIGLTIVAGGTSLPEVATSVMASIKGERDIAVGNVVGSCLFNLLAVLGLAAAVAPGGINVSPTALQFDIPIMIAVTFACLPIFFTGYTIARWEGFIFLAYYVAYTAFLLLYASAHPALHTFATAMLWFALPLTALTLAVTSWREFRSRRRHAG